MKKSAYSQDLWSIWPQLALAPNYHGKARTDLLRREHHYMQSPFISLLLCSQAAMDEAAAWRLSSLVKRNTFIWTDYLDFCEKGQLISKCLFGIFNSFKKQTKKIWHTGSTIRNWDKVKTWLDQMFKKSIKKWCSVASWVVEIYAWPTNWKFFDLMRSQWPPSERVPYISEKLDFWWSIPQKITSIGYFGASDDQTIRNRNVFEEIGH